MKKYFIFACRNNYSTQYILIFHICNRVKIILGSFKCNYALITSNKKKVIYSFIMFENLK